MRQRRCRGLSRAPISSRSFSRARHAQFYVGNFRRTREIRSLNKSRPSTVRYIGAPRFKVPRRKSPRCTRSTRSGLTRRLDQISMTQKRTISCNGGLDGDATSQRSERKRSLPRDRHIEAARDKRRCVIFASVRRIGRIRARQ